MGTTGTGVSLGPGQFDEVTGTHRFEYDEDEVPATMAAVAAVVEVSGQDPTELTPVQETVDSDALDLLTRSTGNGDVHVSWKQEDYRITVSSDGVVAVGQGADGQPAIPANGGRR
jgi:hypothetical protein